MLFRSAVKAIASRDEIALHLTLLIPAYKSYPRLTGRDIRQLDVLDVEKDVLTLVEACGNQVLDDFMLRVQRDGAPVRQVGEGNAMPLSIEAQLDAVMHSSFDPSCHPSRDTAGSVSGSWRTLSKSWKRASWMSWVIWNLPPLDGVSEETLQETVQKRRLNYTAIR